MAKAHQRVMEMGQHEMKAVVKKRHVILERVTLLEKIIKIPNHE
jgi:hypothetical protein